MRTWVITLCGSFAIRCDGRSLGDAIPGRQGRLLAGWLVLHRERATARSELIDLLWPERPPAGADGALSALLSKLRRALGEGVLTSRSEIRLVLDGDVSVDAEALETATQRALAAAQAGEWPAAADAAREALAAARGPFLPDCDGGWASGLRDRLDDARVQAHEVIARAALADDDLAGAESAARAAAEAAPWREASHRLLMEVHEAAGNPAEALRVYEELRARLRRELGIAPTAETLATHERLLRGTPPPAAQAGAAGAGGRGAGRGEPAALPGPVAAARERHVLVGRTRALAALEEGWRTAATGQGRLALLCGEAGIGKTRVAAEFAARAHADGAAVLYGRCDEDRLAPYQPVAEMLRGAGAEGIAERLGEFAADLALLLPELSGGGSRPGSPPEPGTLRAEVDPQRLRFFDAVAAALAEVAGGRPLLMVLDDLHWADRPTLQLVRHLVRGPVPRRTLLLGTHRQVATGAPGGEGSLADLLAGLRRETHVHAITLLGLDADEVGELVNAIAGRTAPESFVRALRDETEGNPFFVEEVVRHLGELPGGLVRERLGAAGVPEGVREVTAQRLARLGEDVREALLAAAVIGREFDFGLLGAVLERATEPLVGVLERAVAAGLLREVPERPGRHQFAHALVRATVLDQLSALRRARLHARVGEAILARAGTDLDSWLPSLSRHFGEAAPLEDPAGRASGRAAHFALAAARRAEGLMAWEEAARHYRRALRANSLSGASRDGAHGELLLALGAAEERAGLGDARGTFGEAVALARELGSADLLARAALGFAGIWSTLGLVDDDVVDLLDEALAALGSDDDRLRARVLARLVLELYYAGDPQRRLALSAEAVELARTSGDPGTLAVCLDARHYALWQPENVEERLAVAGELRRIAREHGDPELELEGLGWIAVDELELGDVAAFDARTAEIHELAEQVRRPLYRWWASLLRCTRAQLTGDLEEAERLAGETLAIGLHGHADNAVHYYGQAMFNIRREQDRLAEVEEAVRAFVRQYPAVPAWSGVLALALVEQDRLEEARESFEAIAAPGFAVLPRDANWMIAITLAAEVCVALGDRPRAEELIVLLAPHAERNVVVGRASACNGSAARHLGLLATLLGRHAEADGHFASALAMHERMGARLLVARTKVDWAASRRARGQDAAADELLDEARLLAESLGLAAVARRAQVLART